MNKINKNNPALGTISVNTYQGGAQVLFGQSRTDKSAVSMEFNRADLNGSFNDELKLSSKSIITRLHMTAEQWSAFLMNKDTDSGTPVTILFDKDGPIENPKEDMSVKDETFNDFEQDIKEKFKNVRLMESSVMNILKKDKILKSEKDEIQKAFNVATELISKEKRYMENEVDAFIQKVEATAQTNFINGIKENMLNIKPIALIEDKSTTVIKNRFQGMLVLKTITDTKNTLVKDYEANNGVSITLYRAEVIVNGDTKTIKRTDEKILEVKMSNSQFSQFMISFGTPNKDCTLSNVYGEDIPTYDENINDEVVSVYKLYDFLDKIDTDIEENKEELTELLSKGITKERRRLINFVFEKISRLTGSNFFFYSRNVFNSGIKYSIRRQEDVQSGMMNGLYRQSLEKFQKDIALLGGEEGKKFLENITKS